MRPPLVLVVLVAFAALVATAHASRRDWTGTAACGACHPKELAAWQASPHAQTRARFAQTPPQQRCLACHATGEAPAGPAIAVEVGCEACHGAGAAYAPDDVMRDKSLARALGLADLSTPKLRAAACAGCHARATSGRAFDPAAPVHDTGGLHPGPPAPVHDTGGLHPGPPAPVHDTGGLHPGPPAPVHDTGGLHPGPHAPVHAIK